MRAPLYLLALLASPALAQGIAQTSGGAGGGDASAANQQTEITLQNGMKSLLSSPLAVNQAGTWNVGTVGSITNPIGLAAGSQVIGSIANTSFGATQSGTWNVGINGTVPVSGTFWQATQPVSGPFATATGQSTLLGYASTIATNSGTQATAAKQDTGNASLATLVTASASGSSTKSQDETNTLAGRGFSWGSGVQTIPANNYFNVQFTNPAGSGKTDYIILRQFGNGSTTVLQAVLRTNCTQIAGFTSVAGGNRYMTNATTTASTLTYQVGTTAISTGTLGPAVMLPINGASEDSLLLRIVPPGQSFCYVVQGLTGAFAASAQVSFSVAGWEQ